ncbi:MAG: 4-hydroxy-3-methylbut-2-enyl diphosphate reductase [bacterium]
MKVLRVEGSGYCAGAKRVVNLTEKALENDGEVYALGDLLHNPQEMDRLKKSGLRVVESISEIESGTLVIRSHGVPARILEEAREKGLRVIDGTCGVVLRLQRIARDLEERGYYVVIVGKKGHPEVVGVSGNLRGDYAVVSTVRDAEELDVPSRKIGVVCQTTFSRDRFADIVRALVGREKSGKHILEYNIVDTTCDSTLRRCVATRALAERVDLMIVVGGHKSSNTGEIASAAASLVETHRIESPEELRGEWFEGKSCVGLSSGLSTPEWLVEEIVERIEKM